MLSRTVVAAIAKVMDREPLTGAEMDALVESVPFPLNCEVTVGPFFNNEGEYGQFVCVEPYEADNTRIVIEWTLDAWGADPHGRPYLRDDRSGAWPLAYLQAWAWFVIEEDVLS